MRPTIEAQAQYTDQVFRGVRLEHSELVASEFHGCTFVRCAFAESIFRNCRFVDCTFRQCDLSLVRISGSAFSAIRFEDSKIIGVDWTQADWTAPRLGDPIGFYRCALNHSTFIGLSLPGIRMKDCIAMDVDFREADLSQADFGGTDLSQSLFANTRLTEADLSCARNYQIDPGQNILTQAKFSLPEAMSLLYNMDIVLTEGVT
jgi:fluoroquinolone resistance protein